MKRRSRDSNHLSGLIPFIIAALALLLSQPATAGNIQDGRPTGISSIIVITESDWTTETSTSDCTSGQGDDIWQLILTHPHNVTITVTDGYCPGDFYEVRVDERLIGTTPNLAPPWGCDYTGPLSSGSFIVPLCPGTHTITVRDAGFDGHSIEEIEDQQMCPAGFTVSGTLSELGAATNPDTGTLGSTQPPIGSQAAQLQQQADAIAPYVVTDSNGIQRLLSTQAQAAGVSQDAIELGKKIVAMNNRIIRAALADEQPSFTPSDFDFIQPLFLQWAEQGNPCGDRDHPSPCPPRVESGEFFSTDTETRDHLISIGYHETAGYAGGGNGRDFTKVVDHPCGFGPFRSQAVIHQRRECWTYNTQSPEPNPEIRSYQWPYFSWPFYVAWWHFRYC